MDFNARLFLVSTSILMFAQQAAQAGTFRPAFKSHFKVKSTTECQQGLQAFEANLYTPILRVACIECHDTGGAGPPHSTSDVHASYAKIKTYIQDFNQLPSSTIVQMVQAKHWLDTDSTAKGVSVDQMMTALQAWWDQGEKTCPDDDSTAQTAQLAVPASLPVFPAESFVPMSWPLDSLGPEFVGSQFQVEIQQFAVATATTGGAYRLRKPRIATPQTGLSLTGIQFYINGKPPENAVGWADIDAQIGGHLPASLPAGGDPFAQAPVLSGRELILLQDQAQGDVVTVAFTGVQVIPAPQCKDLASFQKSILPVIQQSSCISCHSGGAPSVFNGSARLMLSGPDAQVCASVWERTDSVHSDASAFYQIGFLNEYDHPPSVPAPDGFSQVWESWVAEELK